MGVELGRTPLHRQRPLRGSCRTEALSLALQGPARSSKEVAVNLTHKTRDWPSSRALQVGEEHGRDREKGRQGSTEILQLTARV